MFRLAHVTDPHFRGFEGLRVRHLLGKRAAGLANLLFVRGRKHRMELLESLRHDLKAREVDHLAVTGDLSNVALEAEWKAALVWLQATGASPEAVTVIPGNHDTYVREVVEAGTFERLFAPYQTADVRLDAAQYPFVRIRGEVALVSINSCVPTGDLDAWGVVGLPQLQRLEALLGSPELRDRVRVLLIHHPPVAHRGAEERNLRDREAFAAVLARTGAELVLHGHDHRDLHVDMAGPRGAKIPVVGAGSASYDGHADHRSRYNVYDIEGRTITLTTYAHRPGEAAFHETRRERIAG